ncbi:NADH:flavin oxidoreductase [Parasphingorhabdus pacifica]
MPESTDQTLFSPFTVGDLTVPNRIAMAPMTREFSPGGVPDADVVEYYARRAAADVGLIITEGTYVEHPAAGTSDRVPRFYGEEAHAGWSEVVEAVHGQGGKIIPQLWHVGVHRVPGAPPFTDSPVHSPSGVWSDGAEIGDAMSLRDIEETIDAFAKGAASAERLGFDGIELHGAHGYLVDQFLWGRTNHREDRYGGDPISRVRFAADIAAACRDAVSSSFPIFFRTSQWKMGDYQARLADTPDELERLLAPLVEAGVDVFHGSTRRYWTPEFEGSELNLSGWIKKLTGLPTVTVGSVGLNSAFTSRASWEGEAGVSDLDELHARLDRGEFDLVAVGRALLGDPAWASKVRAQRTEDIAPFAKDTLGTLH